MKRILANTALALILAAACVLALFAFNRAAAPHPAILPVQGAQPPDYQAILNTVTLASLRAHHERLCAHASRFTGSDGFDAAARYLREELAAQGLQVHRQPFRITVPRTRLVSLRDAAGNAVPDVRLYPMLPNWFRTVTTPPGGVTGTVVEGERGLAREFEGVNIEQSIVLLPAGANWNTVAGMGAQAVLFYDDERAAIDPRWRTHVDASLRVPRFFVQGNVAGLVGRTVTVAARVDFEERTVENLLAGHEPPAAEEAVILCAYYDAYSYAPDLAPGADQACGAAVLLSSAEFLASESAGHKRALFFLATAGHAQGLFGIREFVRALGFRDNRLQARIEAAREVQEREAEMPWYERVLLVAEDPDYWNASGTEAETAYWEDRPARTRELFRKQLREVLDDDLMQSVEAVTEARVRWVREGMAVSGPDGRPVDAFAAYGAARRGQEIVQSVLTTPAGRLKAERAGYVSGSRLPERVAAHARSIFEDEQRQLAEARARSAIADVFARYKRVLVLGLDLTSRSGRLALICGSETEAPRTMPADNEIMVQFRNAGRALDAVDPDTGYLASGQGLPRVSNLVRGKDERDLLFASDFYGTMMYFESVAALHAGHTAFSLVTLDDGRERLGTPRDVFSAAERDASAIDPLSELAVSARLVTAAASQLARGHGSLVPVSVGEDLHTIRGLAVSQVGENLTPDHPMPGAVIRFGPYRHWRGQIHVPPGVGRDFCVSADRRGRFAMHGVWPHALSLLWRGALDIDAAVTRPEDGQITWTLSTPLSGQLAPYSVRNIEIRQFAKTLATPVLFRCTPVQVLPMADPSTLRPYAGMDFVETESMAVPREYKIEQADGTYVCFVPPETRLYFTFKRGRVANPNLLEIRAFALNASGPADGSGETREIAGEGYLAADFESIHNIEIDAALSMAQVNSRRLALQARYNMADEMLLSYNRHAVDRAETASRLLAQGASAEAKMPAAESVAYSSNIHPVIRKNASDAIVGILFYLFLAIPFAIFSEKLLVGHPDLRVQIMVQGILFVLFFLALRTVHPAYQLVRSSYMILLGFITFGLAAMVTVFVGTRFSRNIAELNQRLRRQSEVADVSRAGAAATAFVLGLGHLRKRPVRTGLTVSILILTTFVMLCFTSISTDQVDVEFPVGRAAYTGLLIRDRYLHDVRSSLAPLRELYGEQHLVAPREWGGTFSVERGEVPKLAEYTVMRADGQIAREARVSAILGLTPEEPFITPVTNAFVTFSRWFQDPAEPACFLSRPVADALRITAADVRAGVSEVSVGGQTYRVLGVFDGRRLSTILDLDGKSLLPVDILSLSNPTRDVAGQGAMDDASQIPEDIPRIPGDNVLITPVGSMPARTQTGSIAVAFQGLDYARAREAITVHLERSAEPSYYGLDGVAFYGGRFRMQSMEGILDLVLPILIAALTVLNTMRGSVYERRDELYVFNAVGLSPAHIRSLFLAEASVYAVVGAVGGYLLAQGITSGLHALGVTAGMSMNYSSLSSVFVSVIIMAVVFLSSLFPARMAARLAAPAELMTRKRETASGDAMELDLPFTFNRRDRIAIVPYFVDWFENYGEGSSGPFYCTDPLCRVERQNDGAAVPCVRVTAWLKPYDLGVSQIVDVVVRHTAETGDNVATVTMTRTSGDRQSWERCCYAFIGLLRKRFLTWRAVPDDHRNMLYERGRALLSAQASGRFAAPTPEERG